MPVAPVPRHARASGGPTPAHGDRARQAVRLAAGAAIAFTAALALFGLAYAVGGQDATADNWVGALVVLLGLGGLLASLTAFALALVARFEHERWALLWLPLSVLPALLAFLVLGEAFWWE